jgi:hypothetical protein
MHIHIYVYSYAYIYMCVCAWKINYTKNDKILNTFLLKVRKNAKNPSFSPLPLNFTVQLWLTRKKKGKIKIIKEEGKQKYFSQQSTGIENQQECIKHTIIKKPIYYGHRVQDQCLQNKLYHKFLKWKENEENTK